MEGGKEGWRDGGWGWDGTLPHGMSWGEIAREDTLLRKDKRFDPSMGSCLCLSLRSGVLAIGLLGSILATSGLVAYAIVQVPTLRVHLGEYFSTSQGPAEEKDSLRSIAYTSEIVGAVLTSCLGLMVNILLVWGVLKNRRWFLIHWLALHLIIVVLLFVTSILIFVVQMRLWKLMGLLPVLLALVIMYSWSKVYQLFCQMRDIGQTVGLGHCNQHPAIGPNLPRISSWRDGQEPQSHPANVEFYPEDTLSRGMTERMRGWNMVCLPYHDQDSPYLGAWERTSHSYRRASESSSSSIVPSKTETQSQGETVTSSRVETVTVSRTDSGVSAVEI